MAKYVPTKSTKRTIKKPIQETISDLHRLIVERGNPDEIKRLQSEVDYFYWGIKIL